MPADAEFLHVGDLQRGVYHLLLDVVAPAVRGLRARELARAEARHHIVGIAALIDLGIVDVDMEVDDGRHGFSFCHAGET